VCWPLVLATTLSFRYNDSVPTKKIRWRVMKKDCLCLPLDTHTHTHTHTHTEREREREREISDSSKNYLVISYQKLNARVVIP
jgi:hypothetical protein